MPRDGVNGKAVKAGQTLSGRFAFALAAGVALLVFTSAVVHAQDVCPQIIYASSAENCTSEKLTAKQPRTRIPAQSPVPFRISVDGETVSASDNAADAQRRTDMALDEVDVQVKFDGLDARQVLAARAVVGEGGPVRFETSTNYANFISAAEVRVFEISGDEAGTVGRDPVKVIGISSSDAATWDMPRDPLKNYGYVFRVYDDKGRFDETRLQEIGGKDINLDVSTSGQDLTGDQARVRNISVHGGAVTVFARNIPVGYSLDVEGMTRCAGCVQSGSVPADPAAGRS